MTNNAVLLLVFNRPKETRKVFERIREIKPKRFFVSADGARGHKPGEHEKCQAVKNIVTNIDWDCQVHYNFFEKNLGCRDAISSGISWFFEHVEAGIIFEDDCVPDISFFSFCDELLGKYKHDERIYCINGNNFLSSSPFAASYSYFFSKYNHCWGWATWKRAWLHFDKNVAFWNSWKNTPEWESLFDSHTELVYWKRIFQRLYEQRMNSWAYAWTASIWYHQGISITPSVNLVTNIGYGEAATHTTDGSLANIPVFSVGHISDPHTIEVNKRADMLLFRSVYYVSLRRRIYVITKRLLKNVGINL
jgi:hypothetical protein